jgi:hypothetical protein
MVGKFYNKLSGIYFNSISSIVNIAGFIKDAYISHRVNLYESAVAGGFLPRTCSIAYFIGGVKHEAI